jgi:hypothetical protein
MKDVAFDAVTRRMSLLSLGAAANAAAIVGPLAANAKNKTRKKLKKKQKQKCQAQVEPCEAVFIADCEENFAGDPDGLQNCLETRPPCCASLSACDLIGFLDCLLVPG